MNRNSSSTKYPPRTTQSRFPRADSTATKRIGDGKTSQAQMRFTETDVRAYVSRIERQLMIGNFSAAMSVITDAETELAYQHRQLTPDDSIIDLFDQFMRTRQGEQSDRCRGHLNKLSNQLWQRDIRTIWQLMRMKPVDFVAIGNVGSTLHNLVIEAINELVIKDDFRPKQDAESNS